MSKRNAQLDQFLKFLTTIESPNNPILVYFKATGSQGVAEFETWYPLNSIQNAQDVEDFFSEDLFEHCAEYQNDYIDQDAMEQAVDNDDEDLQASLYDDAAEEAFNDSGDWYLGFATTEDQITWLFTYQLGEWQLGGTEGIMEMTD